jgi:hypothetical protein
VLVDKREVQLVLAGEVLVQHRLAHAGAVGDLVHRGGVITLGDEDLAGGAEKLASACGLG